MLVRIADYYDPEEALVAQSFLRSGGVEAALVGFNHLAMEPYLRFAFQGYSLWVPAQDADAAKEVLIVPPAEAGSGPGPGPGPEKCGGPRCSVCGSARLRRLKSLLWLPAALLMWIPFLPEANRVKCLDCGRTGQLTHVNAG